MAETAVPDERALLLRELNAQRDHVFGILEGLSDEEMRRPVLPSGWSCVGLVQHLALDDERFWFRTVFAGEPDESSEATENAWQVPPGVSVQSVLELYRNEIERANEIIANSSLDAPPVAWPVEIWPNWRFHNLRQVILHVTTETACHAGHLDAVREIIDGRTWMIVE